MAFKVEAAGPSLVHFLRVMMIYPILFVFSTCKDNYTHVRSLPNYACSQIPHHIFPLPRFQQLLG